MPILLLSLGILPFSRSRLNYCGESWRMFCLEFLGGFEREEILLLAYSSARCEVHRKSRRGIRLERNIARDFANVSRFVGAMNNFEIPTRTTLIYQRRRSVVNYHSTHVIMHTHRRARTHTCIHTYAHTSLFFFHRSLCNRVNYAIR